MKHLALCALAATALLAGCVAPPPPPPTVAQVLDADPTTDCLKAANRDPRLTLLEPKLGSLRSAGQASLPMLASKDYPTATEKVALEIWGSERQRCVKLGESYRAANLPLPLVSAFELGQRDLVFLTAKLYGGELTYGQFNMRRQELAGAHRQRLIEFKQQYAAYLSQIEPQRRLAAAGPAQTMPVAPAVRALFTTCNRYSVDGVNCTSQ
ncbi:hypothetical protein [Xylophilus sp. Leaf220]|uniref:hypothetical protein n=1 Tax=Xylophilus sp. Leaf220 TaxID=1735686 RepID=UPI0006FCA511|nr:hypothetical protein [Xylophilus sp. Leaf220]KQM79882.1 hypothetical protein ASE76_01380 [Xylophilus sp. Leaf220]